MARGDPGEGGYTPQVMPEDLPRKITPRMEGSPVGPALEQLGDTMEKKYQSDSATWAGNQLADFRVQAVKSLEDMKAAAPAGDPGDFTQKYLAQFDKQSAPLAESAGNNPYARQMVQKGLGELRDSLTTHTLDWEAQQRVAFRTDSLGKNLESQLPLVTAHPELADQVGSTLMDQLNSSGLSPKDRLPFARHMDEQLTLAAVTGMEQQNPRGVIEGLKDPSTTTGPLARLTDAQREAVREKANQSLSKPVYTALTAGDTRSAQTYLNSNVDVLDPKTAFSLQTTIDAKVKEKQNDQKQDIADRFTDSMQAAQYGLPNAVTVTRQEMDVLYPKDAQRRWDGLQSTVAAGTQARKYDQMTPGDIQADLQTRVPTQGGPEAAFQIHNYETLARAADQSLKARARDPAQFAIDTGQGWKPLDLSDPQSALGELRSRANSAPQVSAQIGGPVPLLSKGEAGQFSHSLEASTPQQRLSTLDALHDSLPDENAYYSVLRQIAPHSPVTAIVGAKVGQPDPAKAPSWYDPNMAGSPADAARILTGESLLNPTKDEKAGEEGGRAKAPFPMPPDGGSSGLRALYGRAVGDMFRDRPELSDAHFSAFKDAYAALLAEKGDVKGIGDSTLADRALKMSVGTLSEFNGNTVAIPPGMDPTRFDGLVRNAVADAAKSAGAPEDWEKRIRGYQLRELGAVGSGKYELVNGNAPLVQPNGKGPFVIDLKSQYMPGTAGAKLKPETSVMDPMDKGAMSRAAEQLAQ